VAEGDVTYAPNLHVASDSVRSSWAKWRGVPDAPEHGFNAIGRVPTSSTASVNRLTKSELSRLMDREQLDRLIDELAYSREEKKAMLILSDAILAAQSAPEPVVEPVTLEWDGLDCLNDFWGLHIAECEYVNAPTRYQLRFHSWDFGMNWTRWMSASPSQPVSKQSSIPH